MNDEDSLSINEALDQFGMLSSITQSRKEYIQENERFILNLHQLSMNAEKAGPSGTSELEMPCQKNLLFSIDNKPGDIDAASYKVSLLDPKEKENKIFDGLRIVTMNSQFITSFKTGYSFPLSELVESPIRKIFRDNRRRRKYRSHPYEKKSIVKAVDHFLTTNNDILALDQTACRLRTASLSSGTSSRTERTALERHKSVEKNGSCLKRSRSMENLTGLKEDPSSASDCDKAKDIETVSKGIQEMQVEDCT